MKGSVRKRGKTWSYYFDIGRDENGKRRKVEKGGWKTKSEAQKHLSLALAEFESCGKVIKTPSKLSVSEYMYFWLNNYVKNSCKIRTYESYKDIIDSHINKDLGHYYLNNLNTAAIQIFLDKKYEAGYSKNYIIAIHRVLKTALKHAINPYQYLKDNQAQHVNLNYKFEDKKELIITKETVYNIFKFLDDNYSEYKIVYQIAYHTGMRKSEILGLVWDNIDLDNKVIYVTQQLLQLRDNTTLLASTKTRTSNRRIAIGDTLVDILRKHKQALEDNGVNSEFVCIAAGKVITRNRIDYITRLINEAGIKFSLHKLRHCHGSMLYEGGAAVKDISERLGHANCNTSLQIYIKNSDTIRRKTVDLFESML